MAQTLLINPRKRGRKSRRRNPTPSPAQRRARAAFAAAARARSGAARRANPKRRRRNPANYAPVLYASNPRRRARRRNPVGAYMVRRRRKNPISLGGSSLSINSIMGMAKEAAIMGAGAVAMDWGYAQISRYLPASMQAGPGQVTIGTAVKMGITAALGIALNRVTKGISKKAALGAMVVQARDVALTYAPASVAASVAGLGYMSPVPTMNRNLRLSANGGGVGAYLPGMRSPALSGLGAYYGARSPLLNGMRRR